MNMSVKNAVMVAADFTGARLAPRGRRIARVAVVPVSEGLAALTFDIAEAATGPDGGARLGGEIAGRELPRPLVSTRLPLRRGGSRHVLLVGQDAQRLAASSCRLTLDAVEVAALDPSWLQSPLADSVDLLEGLSEEGCRKLLKTFLTTAGSLFGARRATGYGAAVRRLVELIGVTELWPSSICGLGANGRLLSYRMPAKAPVPDLETLVALSEDRVSRVAGFAAQVERHARGTLLHVFVPVAPSDRTLIGFGPEPLVLGIPTEIDPKPLTPWASRRSQSTQVWIGGLVGALADADPTANALLRELRNVDSAPPGIVLRHLSATPRGVLLMADLVDPQGLVTALRVKTDAGERDLDVRARATPTGGRSAIGGFLEIGETVRAGAACSIHLVYGSGRVQTVHSANLEAYCGTIPCGFAEIDPAAAAAALAAARLSLRRPIRTPLVETIGVQPARPKLSLVVAAGADVDILRARAALLFAEPGAGAVDVVYHVGAADARPVRRALSDCHAVYGLGCRLVILPDGADAAEGLRAALESARGAVALALGADVLPSAAGWLAGWVDAFAGLRAPAMIGGTLLSPDGAVSDAGGSLRLESSSGRVRIDRRWTGLPASVLPSDSFALTDLVTATCVGLNRGAMAAFGNGDPHYPDPDVQLLDLAHRLRRRRGAVRTSLDARFIRFGDAGDADPLGDAVNAEAIGALVRARLGEGAK